MTPIQPYIDHYATSHLNSTNKAIHWICIPAIMFSLFGLLYALPFPFAAKGLFANWAFVLFVASIFYYLRLSVPIALGMVGVGFGLVWGNKIVADSFGGAAWQVILGVFVVAWVGQFIGHKIEGKKPSFLEDVQYLLIGPAWLLHFIYKKVGIGY